MIVRRLALTGVVSLCALVGALALGSAVALAAPLEAPEVLKPAPLMASTATLQGILDPGKTGGPFELDTYEFVYRQSSTGCEGEGEVRTPEGGGMSMGAGEEAVSQGIEGLTAGAQYTVCLVVHNEAKTETARSTPLTFTTAIPPEAPDAEPASEVTASAAKLNGILNPKHKGESGSYEFLYRQSANSCEGGSRAPEPAGSSTGGSPESVSAELSGLAPGATYTFCLLARNEAEEVATGTPETFTTLAVAPTVTSESSSEVSASEAEISAQIDPGGSPTTYYVEYGTSTSYGLSTPRESAGAGGQGAAAVQVQVGGLQPETSYHFRVAVSNALGTEYGEDMSFTTLVASSAVTFTLGLPDGRGYEMVSPVANANGDVYEPYGPFLDQEYGEATGLPIRAAADGSAVEYVATPPATGGTGDVGDLKGNEYVATREQGGGWSAVDLETPGFDAAPYLALFSSELVNIGTSAVPAGTHTLSTRVEGSDHKLYDSVEGQSIPVNVLPGGTLASNAEFGDEEDLSHVISADGSRIFWTDLSTGVLYVREDDTSTVPVSAGAAEFSTATPDGRYAFYTEGGTLWRFDVEGQTREELAGSGAAVQGVIGASEDGEYVYFVAKGALAEGATPGGYNLYLRERGVTIFIATLSELDDGQGTPHQEGQSDWAELGLGERNIGLRSAEVTPDGHSLVFVSIESLTSYDSETNYNNYGTWEVYVYDADTHSIACASCNPGGEPPTGFGGDLPRSGTGTFVHRWISDDGMRVFFETAEALVPQDTNGEADVYEWERDGTGSCNHGGYTEGCIYLLSAGTSTSDSFLIDASASGDDVFIITRSQLVPQDPDENFNVFDVRVGVSQPISPPVCTGSGCQGVPAAPPIFATPSSVTFSGVGNFVAPSGVTVKAKTLTRAQKLAKARKACRARRAA